MAGIVIGAVSGTLVLSALVSNSLQITEDRTETLYAKLYLQASHLLISLLAIGNCCFVPPILV